MGGAIDYVANMGTDMFNSATNLLFPKPPPVPGTPPTPDPADAQVRAARTMERRKQLGLSGRMSTYLTTSLEPTPSALGSDKTLLGQ